MQVSFFLETCGLNANVSYVQDMSDNSKIFFYKASKVVVFHAVFFQDFLSNGNGNGNVLTYQ